MASSSSDALSDCPPNVAVGDRPFAPSLDGLERRLRSLDWGVELFCCPRVLDLALYAGDDRDAPLIGQRIIAGVDRHPLLALAVEDVACVLGDDDAHEAHVRFGGQDDVWDEPTSASSTLRRGACFGSHLEHPFGAPRALQTAEFCRF
jgi:hypothetical protein